MFCDTHKTTELREVSHNVREIMLGIGPQHDQTVGDHIGDAKIKGRKRILRNDVFEDEYSLRAQDSAFCPRSVHCF